MFQHHHHHLGGCFENHFWRCFLRLQGLLDIGSCRCLQLFRREVHWVLMNVVVICRPLFW
jgi:hypothetical protein